jgi:hypothetical protein
MATMAGGDASFGARPLTGSRRVTDKGESGFGIANGRGTAFVEQYYGEPFKTA